MKKVVIVIAVLIGWVITSYAQPCLPEGIEFDLQSQIDSFQYNYPGCTEIEGDVSIIGYDIINLDGLSVLTSFGSDLEIWGSFSITSLSGLINVTHIDGNLEIRDCDALNSLAGLDNLNIVYGDLNIKYNTSLVDLTGLGNLTSVGGNIMIYYKSGFISLAG